MGDVEVYPRQELPAVLNGLPVSTGSLPPVPADAATDPVLPEPGIDQEGIPQVIYATNAGDSWIPSFIISNDMENCICCTACYVVCGRDVFDFVVRPDQHSGCGAKVMMIARPGNCVGCGACERSCPRHNLICKPKPARNRMDREETDSKKCVTAQEDPQ
jgi:NAD-dependent dihydropyrimidine dehydrogenase PreA subunit